MSGAVWAVFVVAAVLEVGGDALIRVGLRGEQRWLIALGIVSLGSYGLVVNLLRSDFAKIFGAYVAVFACMSVLFGRFVFRESIAPSTWLGLWLIVVGGLVIQLGDVHRGP